MRDQEEREKLRLEKLSKEVRRETLAVYKVLGPGYPEDVYLRFLERGVWRRRPPTRDGDPEAGKRTGGIALQLARLFGLEPEDGE
jgi:hypothetical protein